MHNASILGLVKKAVIIIAPIYAWLLACNLF